MVSSLSDHDDGSIPPLAMLCTDVLHTCSKECEDCLGLGIRIPVLFLVRRGKKKAYEDNEQRGAL